MKLTCEIKKLLQEGDVLFRTVNKDVFGGISSEEDKMILPRKIRRIFCDNCVYYCIVAKSEDIPVEIEEIRRAYCTPPYFLSARLEAWLEEYQKAGD